MWRVIGSSPERIRITDLGDVIYYRQVKDYSDQEYESSKDLRKAIQRGTVTIIEHAITPRSIEKSNGGSHTTVMNSSMDMEAFKQAVREVLPENPSMKESFREVVPTLVDMVRQEISSALSNVKIQGATVATEATSPEFMGPEYIPDISADGMISNINIEGKEVSGSDVSSNLALLKKLRNKQSK